MDHHKKEWEEKPVVLDKPRRGREMVTTVVPKDMLDSMRMVTAKQQLKSTEGLKPALQEERQGGVETYHEGWMDGKKYLVPDSNLEIMKDLVNLKVRRKGDSVYVKKKDYQTGKLDTDKRFQEKLKALSDKIDELEKAKVFKMKSAYKTSQTNLNKDSKGTSLGRRKPFEIVPMSDESSTFLISGHIRANFSPMFIIQKYKGKSPFGRKRPDFSQVQSARNVDVMISGNFYRHSVLEEGLHAIEGIRLKWDLLVPVDERSKLYEKRFSEHFNIKGVDVLFEGDFIKEKGLLNYTPILTFLVPRPASLRRRGGRRKKWKDRYRAIHNVFNRGEVTTYNVQLDNKPSMRCTTDEFNSRENSNIQINSVEEFDKIWGNSGEELSSYMEKSTEQDKRSEFSIDDVGSCKIHLVVVPIKKGKRSVAGGSSTDKAPEDKSSTAATPVNNKEWKNREDDGEETFVVQDELWSPFCSVEPNIRSWSSQGTTCDRERGDHGDAGRDRCTTEEDKREESSTARKILPGRPKPLRELGVKLAQRTFSRNKLDSKDVSVDYEIPEYKCQVRPSKRRSQPHCLLRSISKLFSK